MQYRYCVTIAKTHPENKYDNWNYLYFCDDVVIASECLGFTIECMNNSEVMSTVSGLKALNVVDSIAVFDKKESVFTIIRWTDSGDNGIFRWVSYQTPVYEIIIGDNDGEK